MNMKEKLDKLIDEIEVDDEMVLAAAKDINKILRPNPLLDLEKPGEELQKDVEELFPNLISGDALSDMTWNILKALGWKSANQEQATNKKGDQPVKEKTKMETNAGEFAMAAADIQKSLAVNPPLDLNVGEEALKEELELLLPNIQEGDDLAVTTWVTLKKLGWGKKILKQEKKKVSMKNTGKQKAEKQKVDKIPKERKPRISDVIRDGLKSKLDTEEILRSVKKIFPEAKTSPACVAWYRNQENKSATGSEESGSTTQKQTHCVTN